MSRFLFIGAIVVLIISCEKEDEHPKIETLYPSNISSTDAVLMGKFNNKGTYKILEFGFEFGSGIISDQYSYPNFISLGSKVLNDTFQYRYVKNSNINELTYRAYVKNTKGYIYAGPQKFYFSNPTVNSLSVAECNIGDTITIIGDNFGSTLSQVKILVDNKYAKTVNVNNQEIKFIVPSDLPIDNSNHTVKLKIFDSTLTCGSIRIAPFFIYFEPTKAIKNSEIKIHGKYLAGKEFKVLFNDIEYSSIYGSDILYLKVPKNLTDSIYNIFVTYKTDTFSFEETFKLLKPDFRYLDRKKAYAGMRVEVNAENYDGVYSSKVNLGDSYELDFYIHNDIISFLIPTIIANDKYPLNFTFNEVEYPTNLNIEIVKPTCIDMEPDSGVMGSTISLIGENFVPNSDNLKFWVSFAYRTRFGTYPIYKNENLLEFVVPDNLYPGGTYETRLLIGDIEIYKKEFKVLKN